MNRLQLPDPDKARRRLVDRPGDARANAPAADSRFTVGGDETP